MSPTSDSDAVYLVSNPYTYFNISPKTMRQLMLTTSKLSEITNPKKIEDTKKMKIKLEIFNYNLLNILFPFQALNFT